MVLADDKITGNRILGLRMRPDLELRPQRFGQQRFWAVKDPVSLQYFHLRDEEHAVLTMLDGRTSGAEIRRRFAGQFAPRSLGDDQLHGFLATLHRHGLVLAEATGQATQLLERHDQRRRRQRWQAALGLLAIRFRGLHPGRLLDWLEPKCRWLFSPWCVAGALLLAVAALTLVGVEFEIFRQRLPDFRTFVAASNLPWLVLALAATKILHELGHALACRHFAGECHEIGVLLLVGVPCLYCNVSDSWMFPSKWQRIAVAAAGIYVELILASLATFLWWWSAPGVINSLCLNTMLVCSLGTVLFNGNPLLRYDGYYILSDLVEVPNLGAQSMSAAKRIAGSCFGIALADDPATPSGRRGPLVLYAVASTAYRWFVVIAIFWALRELARPYHAEALVVMLAGLTLLTMCAPTAAAIVRVARDPSRRRRVAPSRAVVSGGLVVAALLVLAFVPMPMRVSAPVMIEYRDAQRVYVTVPGAFVSGMRSGQKVERGQTLAQLASDDVRLEVARLRSERDRQQLFLDTLEAQRLQGSTDGARLPAAKAALEDVKERLAQVERDAARLTISAPASGTVLPPPNRPAASPQSDTLDSWSDVPLADRNVNTYFDTGTMLCLVGDPNRFEAILHVEQSDIDLVREGQTVRMVLDHQPDRVLQGRVVEIAKLDLKVMPRELAAARDLPARVDRGGAARPLNTWYQARVVFDDQPAQLVARVHGRAKIAVDPQSVAAQCARFVAQAFSR